MHTARQQLIKRHADIRPEQSDFRNRHRHPRCARIEPFKADRIAFRTQTQQQVASVELKLQRVDSRIDLDVICILRAPGFSNQRLRRATIPVKLDTVSI